MRFAHINAGSQADKAVLGQIREGSISQGNQFGEGFTADGLFQQLFCILVVLGYIENNTFIHERYLLSERFQQLSG